MRKYVASNTQPPTITAMDVAVTDENTKTFKVKGKLFYKVSELEGWFDTWEEAFDFLVHKAKERLENAHKSFLQAQHRVAAVNKLKREPQP